jgi:hypothetical protein
MEAAEEFNARPGVFIIRRHKITGEETRKTVVRAGCARKTDVSNKICNKDEAPFMSFVGPEELYDDRHNIFGRRRILYR